MRFTTALLFSMAAFLLAADAAGAARPRLVLLICDGLRPDAITPERAPHLSRLRRQAAYTDACRNDLPPVTMTNHATLFSGLRARRHGVYLNVAQPGHFRRRSLLDQAAAAGLRCVFFASKDKLGYFARPEACETIDLDGDMSALAERFLAQLDPAGPDVLVLHLREPDSTGHRSGWLSEDYLTAVGRVDEVVGKVADRLGLGADHDRLGADRVGLSAEQEAIPAGDLPDRTASAPARPSYLMITADHGGEGFTHLLDTPANRNVPWFVLGPDIVAGAISGSCELMDVCPTALALLDLPPLPDLDGRARQDIRATAAEPAAADPSAPAQAPPAHAAPAPGIGQGAACSLLGAGALFSAMCGARRARPADVAGSRRARRQRD